jgi:flagellar secretion chaperone FliS
LSAHASSAYRTVGTVTADPIVLTTMLFDGAVTALKKARLALEDGRRDVYTRESVRAYEIIGELLATLDMTQGEVPERLSAIYTYCMRLVVESAVSGPAGLEDAGRYIASIGAAWKAATEQLRGEGGPQQGNMTRAA